MEAKLRIYKPECSSASLAEVQAAILGASQLLEERCRLRLLSQTTESLALNGPWCQWPLEPGARAKALAALSAQAKAGRSRDLALFLLPTEADQRLSWALVDSSPRSACDSPQEARFLARFGSLFFTDVTWLQGAPRPEDRGPSFASLLVAHEVLHALTQRGHPTQEPRGNVMADHITDMGPAIDEDWCSCARLSPYASLPRGKR